MLEALTWKLHRAAIAVAGLVIIGVAIIFLATSSHAQAKYASIIIDADTGEVLHEVSADELNYPASLTKMMTLYLAFEALDNGQLKLDQQLSVSTHAASRMRRFKHSCGNAT